MPARAHRGASVRADLISPGTPLLAAVVNKVMVDFGPTLRRGAVLVDDSDLSTDPRLLVYLDHTITDGREVHGTRQVVSRRFHYVEIDRAGNVGDPGDEPYLNYAPLTQDQQDTPGRAARPRMGRPNRRGHRPVLGH